MSELSLHRHQHDALTLKHSDSTAMGEEGVGAAAYLSRLVLVNFGQEWELLEVHTSKLVQGAVPYEHRAQTR